MVKPRPASAEPIVEFAFPRNPRYGQADIAAVTAVLQSGRLSDIGRGPHIAALEDAYAAAVGVNHALTFNSGTAALHAATHATGAATAGTGVVTSPLTWISAIAVTFHAGSFPVFADIEPGSVNLDPHATPPDPTAVLVTHTFGVPARVDAILDRAHGMVIEDCSHAHGAALHNRPVGSWGAAGCFSLMDRKPVSAGEGGVLTTNSRTVFEATLTLGHHPDRLTREITDPDLLALAATGLGYKTRMPVLAAAIGLIQLDALTARNACTAANMDVLTRALAGAPVTAVPGPAGAQRGWYRAALWITQPVPDPAMLYAACERARLPVRPIYSDWLTTPLLTDRRLASSRFPHLRHTAWQPPDPDAFPNYYTARRQLLLLKLPDVPADDYLAQVADVLAAILDRHL